MVSSDFRVTPSRGKMPIASHEPDPFPRLDLFDVIVPASHRFKGPFPVEVHAICLKTGTPQHFEEESKCRTDVPGQAVEPGAALCCADAASDIRRQNRHILVELVGATT